MGSEQDPPADSGPPDDAQSGPAQPPADDTQEPSPPDQPAERPSGGSMRRQDAETTRPRPPTVGEARAREKAIRKQQEIEEARQAAEEKRQRRNRRLIGGAAVVGVVGVVAAFGYWALRPEHVTAQCVQEDPNGQPVVVPDNYCTGHSAGPGGFYYFGGHQYRYYYGSSGDIGTRPVGGTTVQPKGTTITTKSGTTIQRGGLGSTFGGSKSGGS